MKLSIIIPVYNVELYIESCLKSVLNQSNLKDTEIILVDDCGKDNSINIAKNIVDSYKDSCNIKIISHSHNQGLSAARNTGIKHAQGDYLFFLDSDDELPENTINVFNHYLFQYGDADFFIGNYIVKGSFNGGTLKTKKTLYDDQGSILNAYINNDWYVMACGKFINRLFFIQNDLWFEVGRLHEDELFSFKLALFAKTMIGIKENIYRYKIRDNSITSFKKRKNYVDLFWIITNNIGLYYNYQSTSNLYNRKIVDNYFKQLLFNYSIDVVFSKLKNDEKIILLKWSKSKYKQFKWMQVTLKNLIIDFIMNLKPYFTKFIIACIYNYKQKSI